MRISALLFIILLLASPARATQPSRATILIYSGTSGYRHESIPAGIAAVTAIAQRRGLAVVAIGDPAVFASGRLRHLADGLDWVLKGK